MNYILLDIHWRKLLPLCFGRPIGQLLIGMETIESRWARKLSAPVKSRSAAYLHPNADESPSGNCIAINSALLPDSAVITAILALNPGESLMSKDVFLAGNFKSLDLMEAGFAIENGNPIAEFAKQKSIAYTPIVRLLARPADIFACNDAMLRADFADLGENLPHSTALHGVSVKGQELRVHPSATVEPCLINTEAGPVVISEGAEVMEGCMLRGPLFIGKGTTVKMGTKIYGATSIGEQCRVGGEVNNAVMNSFSNKGHDGFLGNSVLGSWCNLGADTNTSNLKNNYSPVRVWSYETDDHVETGLQFHGLIMGDFSKAGINSMFNTGTVVGMHANIFNAGFPPKFIPSFSWADGLGKTEAFRMEKAIEAAQAMMHRRGLSLSEIDPDIFRWVMDFERARRAKLGMLA